MTIVKNHQRFVALGLLGASVALSGCITTGNFDASKSFMDTYAAIEETGEDSYVHPENQPSGSVSYSGGFAVEALGRIVVPDQAIAGEALAADEPGFDTSYIVGQLDVDVAFDTREVNLEASNLNFVTSSYSIFGGPFIGQSKTGGNAIVTPEGLTEADIVVGESIDGTLTGIGGVYYDVEEINVFGVMDGDLSTGSGEGAETAGGVLSIDTFLHEGANGQFLLGGAALEIYPDTGSGVESAEPTYYYEGAAYAEEQ